MAKTVWLKNNDIKHVLQHNLRPTNPITSIDGFDCVELDEDIAKAFLTHAPGQFEIIKEADAKKFIADRDNAPAVLEPDQASGQREGESLDEFAARTKAEGEAAKAKE